jgi:hypothetical protein
MGMINDLGILLTLAVVALVMLLIFGRPRGRKDDEFDRDADDRFGNIAF